MLLVDGSHADFCFRCVFVVLITDYYSIEKKKQLDSSSSHFDNAPLMKIFVWSQIIIKNPFFPLTPIKP